MAFPVVILNYKRPKNIENHILPALLKEECVSIIIIAHGEPTTVFGVSKPLLDGEFIKEGKLWHFGDYSNNQIYRCFRRWLLILRLKSSLPGDCVMVQDDDVVFQPGELIKLYNAYKEGKGVLVSGTHGRNLKEETYNICNIFGPCDIVIGQNMLGSIDNFCNATQKIIDKKVPIEIVAFEDDIAMCCMVLDKTEDIKHKQHYSLNLARLRLPENDAVCLRPKHLECRTRAIQYWLSFT